MYETRRDSWLVSDHRSLLDVDLVHRELAASYWSPGIPRDVVARAIANSLCFGLYDTSAPPHAQVGFARAITDRATFAYLADVFVLPRCRGNGLGVWMMRSVLAHPELQGLRRVCLMTRDAHGLYAKLGFAPMRDPSRYMEIHRPQVYSTAGGGTGG